MIPYVYILRERFYLNPICFYQTLIEDERMLAIRFVCLIPFR